MSRLVKRHKTLLVAAATAAMLLALPACSTSKNTTGQGSALTFWYNPLDPPALVNLYKAYEKASGVKLNLQKLPGSNYASTVLTKWESGQRPDILEFQPGLSQIAKLNPKANLVDLSNLAFVKREGETAKSSGYFDGQTYAATLGPNAQFGIFYNKQVLAQHNLTPPKTFADLFSMCKVLKSQTIFEAGGDGWPPYGLGGVLYPAQANVGDAYTQALVNKSQTLDDPTGPFVKGLQAYAQLHSAGCFNKDAVTATFAQSVTALLHGQTAMVVQLSSAMIGQLNQDENGDTAKVDATIGFAGVSANAPIVSDTPNLNGTLYVPKTGNSSKQSAAISFINWVTGPGYPTYVKQAAILPTLSGVPVPTKLQGLWVDIENAEKVGTSPTWITNLPASTAMGTLIDQVLAGQISPDTAGKRMQVSFLQELALLK